MKNFRTFQDFWKISRVFRKILRYLRFWKILGVQERFWDFEKCSEFLLIFGIIGKFPVFSKDFWGLRKIFGIFDKTLKFSWNFLDVRKILGTFMEFLGFWKNSRDWKLFSIFQKSPKFWWKVSGFLKNLRSLRLIFEILRKFSKFLIFGIFGNHGIEVFF